MNAFKILGAALISSALCFAPMIYAAEVSDTSITNDIKTKLSADPITSTLNLSVKSDAGVVTLSGNVKTDQEASKAMELVESTPGVSNINVSNLLVEKSNHPFADTIITAKVKGTFIREKIFGDANDVAATGISVTTTNGTVVLTGEVASQDQIDNAIKLAKSIDGVKTVDSKLTIKPTPTA